MNQEKFEQAIRKAIADRTVQSPQERLRIYDAARAALARRSSADPSLSETLEAVIEKVESSFTPKTRPEANTGTDAKKAGSSFSVLRMARSRSLPLFIGGALLGAAFTALGFVATAGSAGPAGTARQKLEAKYANSLKLLPAAEDFLGKVSSAVLDMQKKDGAAVEAKAGKKFIPLKELDESLAKQMATSFPPGTWMVLRANRKDFKILLNWTLCGAASIARPELVDHVRSKTDTLSCPYFGIWTQGAANW